MDNKNLHCDINRNRKLIVYNTGNFVTNISICQHASLSTTCWRSSHY